MEPRTGLTLMEGRGQKEKGQRSGATALKTTSLFLNVRILLFFFQWKQREIY